MERKVIIEKIRAIILAHLPNGFTEELIYKMIGYVVPHNIYPQGYHCDSNLPLPFINLASQKNYIALYHLGFYIAPELRDWFEAEYSKKFKSKLDMGKGCIRFKNMADIPYGLIGELAGKISVDKWIELYEKSRIDK